MRRRILLAMVSIALVTVVVLGVPMAVFGRMAVRHDAAVRADREADAIGFALADRLDAGDALPPPALLERFVAGGRYLVITDRAGTVTTAGTRPADDTTFADIDAADGSHIRLYVPDGDVDRRESLVLLTVGGLAVAAVAAAVGIGVVLSRRLVRPLDTLAATARRLGDGDFAARTHPTGVGEVDAVGATLDDGARRIGRLVAAEREFSANASHQLRTPLTALRMRLEEIDALGDVDVRSEATAALAQVDRLDTTITDLLRLARDGNAGPTLPLDLEHLARTRAAHWDHLARSQHRHVVVDAAGPAWAQASVGAAGHALDILLDNALRHGDGTITLSVQHDDDVSTIDITDQGPGIPVGHEVTIFRRGVTADGSGIGLALADDLVSAEHGRLTLVGSQPARFRITYRTPPDGAHRTAAGRPAASPVEPRTRRGRSRTDPPGPRIFTESWPAPKSPLDETARESSRDREPDPGQGPPAAPRQPAHWRGIARRGRPHRWVLRRRRPGVLWRRGVSGLRAGRSERPASDGGTRADRGSRADPGTARAGDGRTRPRRDDDADRVADGADAAGGDDDGTPNDRRAAAADHGGPTSIP